MIRLYLCDVRSIDAEKALDEVSPARREKALRLKNADDRRRSLAAALLMKKVLGTDETKTRDNGKPYVDGAEFSLSHSGDIAVLAVADCPVGVDIEKLRPCNMRLAERYFSPAECAAIARSDAPDREFTRAWVQAESRVKCSGKGISGLGRTASDACYTQSLTRGEYELAVSTTKDAGDVEIISI